VGSAPLHTYEGKDLHEVLEKLPCDLIIKDGTDFKVKAVLVIDEGKGKKTLPEPVIRDQGEIKEIEHHCSEKH
jgi:hypothetical protein